jgi:ABC-type glycerol-3-phosphate transport system substrate-binding protein
MLVFSTVAAGCSSDNSGGKDAAKGGDSGGEVVITMWGASDFLKADNAPGVLAIQEFNEKHKGKIRVERKYMPWTEYNTAVQAAVTSNSLPDIFQTPRGMDIRDIIAKGWIRPYDGIVSDDWKKQFMPGALVEGINVVGGKTYTWTLTGPQLLEILFYNKDVLKNAGLDPDKPPKTWAEFRQMCKTITDKGKGDVFGLVGGFGETSPLPNKINAFAAGTDPAAALGFNYKTGQYSYDSKPWVDAMNFVLQLKKDGSILPASYTMKQQEAAVLFGSGKAGFLIDGRARMWLIKRDTPKANFGMTVVPSQDGSKPYLDDLIARSNGYMVSAKTKHPKEVGIFLEEFASPMFYKKYLHSGVALTPIESINKDKSLYPYPEFDTFYQLHKDHVRLRPDPAIRNPQAVKVIAEMGSMQQPSIKPNLGETVQMLLAGKETDVQGVLTKYTKELNDGLKAAVEKVQKQGAKVSLDDFKFPNWDPSKDFTEKDYQALKK